MPCANSERSEKPVQQCYRARSFMLQYLASAVFKFPEQNMVMLDCADSQANQGSCLIAYGINRVLPW